jgi:hypothetical protein
MGQEEKATPGPNIWPKKIDEDAGAIDIWLSNSIIGMNAPFWIFIHFIDWAFPACFEKAGQPG